MKKTAALFFMTVILLPELFSQGFSLTLTCRNTQADSVHIQNFDGRKEYHNILSAPFSEQVTLKQKSVMPAGYYLVSLDTIPLFTLLVSEEKRQSISVSADATGSVVFSGSEENQAVRAYELQIFQYEEAHRSIYQQFTEAQKSVPEYMLQTMAERLQAQDAQISEEEEAYKDSIAAAFKGSILGSMAQFAKALPLAPQEYYQNRTLMRQHYCQHCFDNYPFDDSRMVTVPVTAQRLREFCGNVLYLAPNVAAQLTSDLLTKAQANAHTYHYFYDWLAKTFGSQGTPFYNETIYLAMLDNALSYPALDKEHQSQCRHESKMHRLNMEGTTIANFNVLWADGTRSTLHDVDAEYMLVYFQNPECPECTMIRGFLAENKELNQAIASGRLKVVTIYFEPDETLWRRYLAGEAKAEYLHGWDVNGEIDAGTLFDLRAIPYMFLVDKDKKILKKDLLYNEISQYIRHYHIID